MMNGHIADICAQCGSGNVTLLLCGACRSVKYCSRPHQVQHWPTHKVLCKNKANKKTTKHIKLPIDNHTSNNKVTVSHCRQGQTSLSSGQSNNKSSLALFDKTLFDEIQLEANGHSIINNDGDIDNDSINLTSVTTDNIHDLSNISVSSDFSNTIKSHMRFQNVKEDQVERKISTNSEPDLSTPIDMGTQIDPNLGHDPHTTPTKHSLFHVDLDPDTSRLAESGFGSEWFENITDLVLNDLNTYGVCAVDKFLGDERANQVLEEVRELHQLGQFQDGQVVSRRVQGQAREMIRGDKITWVTGQEPGCSHISQLITIVDSIIAKANRHPNAQHLSKYNITLRTRAMVACYPGSGTHYVKHVDNPNGDGRCITAIYYVNYDWIPQNGGVLRIFPECLGDQMMQIDPLFDRMLFFWSDRRNPHEVLPSNTTRYAITVWYLDQIERERHHDSSLQCTSVASTSRPDNFLPIKLIS